MRLTLKNGLEVILEENHTAPVVALQAWVGVGSADEPPELAGIAHLFEHMLFKGTKKRGVGQIAREVEAAGGDINAWTSFDETVFHIVLASSFFDTGLDILADALTSSTFDPDELERERKVVLEEIRQGEDSPDRVASENLFAAAFPTHPYGRPIIGTEASVRALRRSDLLGFFEERYVAGNVTLVVVGDFDIETARRAVEAAFSGMRTAPPPPARVPERPQIAPVLRVAERDVKEAHLLFGFRAPSIRSEDVPALDLLAVALGQGDSSRLNLEVVRNEQLATHTSAYVLTPRDEGLFVVGAELPSERVDAAARALLDETLRLAREDMAPEELAKVRTMLESDIVFDKETVQGYARKLGFFARIAGDPSYEERYFRRLRALGPADLRAVAARYLRVPRMTAAALVPRGAGRQAARAAEVEDRLRAVVAAAESRSSRTLPAAPAEPTGEAVRDVLPSDTKVIVLRDSTVPVVAVRAAWAGGLRFEDARSNGITHLLASLMTRGTKTRSAEQIMHEVEGMAGSIGGVAGRDSFGLHAEFLAEHWERGLEIFADCVRNPAFAEDELDRERRIVLDELKAQEDDLGQESFRLFYGAFWKKHPYRMDLLGAPESVAGVTRRRLMDQYRRFYPLSAMTLAVVGDVDEPRLLAKLRALFADRVPATGETPAVPSEPPRTAPTETFRFFAKQQAHVVLGFPGSTFKNPDRYALEVLAQILSGHGGRLFSEMREKRALVYQVSAFSVEGVDPGFFGVYLACSPENLDEAVGVARRELARVLEKGVTSEEIARARRYLIGTHAIALQRRSALAAVIALHEAYGQGWREYKDYADEIDRVSAADVVRVARGYLAPGRETLAVIKPEEGTPGAVRALGAGGPRAGAARREGEAADGRAAGVVPDLWFPRE